MPRVDPNAAIAALLAVLMAWVLSSMLGRINEDRNRELALVERIAVLEEKLREECSHGEL